MKARRRTLQILGICFLGASFIGGMIGCVEWKSGCGAEGWDEPAISEGVPPTAGPVATEVSTDSVPRGPLGAEDNYYCFVCHLNYDGEELALNHEIAGVGCATCHGVSDRHSADEDGIVPPEIMFPRARINISCMQCHGRSEIDHIEDHLLLLADVADEKSICTDCHGQHRLNVRTRVWDKATGELVWCDGVRMMYEDSPTR
mgnify:CR=1 FL=1